jgi:hypothetical protein
MRLLDIANELQQIINGLANAKLEGQEISLEVIHKLSRAQQLIEESAGISANKIPLDWDTFLETGKKTPKWR